MSEEEKELGSKEEKINIDASTAFSLKILEYDKNISAAELEVAKLKSEKNDFIYSENVKRVIALHKEQEIKNQIEEETKKKLSENE